MRMLSEDERVIFAIVGSLAGVLLVATATFYCIVRARRQRLAATLRLFQQPILKDDAPDAALAFSPPPMNSNQDALASWKKEALLLQRMALLRDPTITAQVQAPSKPQQIWGPDLHRKPESDLGRASQSILGESGAVSSVTSRASKSGSKSASKTAGSGRKNRTPKSALSVAELWQRRCAQLEMAAELAAGVARTSSLAFAVLSFYQSPHQHTHHDR